MTQVLADRVDAGAAVGGVPSDGEERGLGGAGDALGDLASAASVLPPDDAPEYVGVEKPEDLKGAA